MGDERVNLRIANKIGKWPLHHDEWARKGALSRDGRKGCPYDWRQWIAANRRIRKHFKVRFPKGLETT